MVGMGVDDVVVTAVLVVATGLDVVVEVVSSVVDSDGPAAPSEVLVPQPVRTIATAAMPQTNLIVFPLPRVIDSSPVHAHRDRPPPRLSAGHQGWAGYCDGWAAALRP